MSDDFSSDLPLLTARQAIEFIRNELGIPITKSTCDKLSMLGQGPAVSRYYGKRRLFTRPGLREWSQVALSTREPSILVDDDSSATDNAA
jgi:hypothetical protein